ncbi:fatty-acid-binding protein 1 [Prunus yedoensis var. nudiflora]|uniref:Fatty-acid-binding protein 1 n=1 Tax=Prunus yedoensis var. nudiflora TaxID=2094558 RepID=A0A314Z616_PRUYE|nr:fatty-acid-binding protein 1 [Prunus yedoensis var. nudiflora]
MVSFRFPFSFPQPPKHTPPTYASSSSATSRPFSATTAAVSVVAGAAAVAGVAAATHNSTNQAHPFLQNALNLFFANRSLPLWGSLSLSDTSSSVVDSKTGASFPSVLDDSRRLLGIGLRRKRVFGLKNIDVYAFGIYADDKDIKELLSEKYGKLSVSELQDNNEYSDDLLETDIGMTVRLQIVYGRLSISSVRSAFEESVGSRLRKFGGSDNQELLQTFTSQFKDEYKIPKGSVIDLSRERGYVLRTTIDGKEVGSIESKLLCKSLLDLYIGEEPFDEQAKEDVKLNLASLLHK